MSLNAPSEAKLRGVRPDLARVARRASELTTQPFQIVQGNRTQAEQNAIYSQGRTRPGPIVTWTKNSKHIGGGAIDFAALVNGKINWDSKYYPPIAAAFKKAADESGVGIAWGGDWKTKDWGHIQLIAGAMARLPSQEQQNAGSIPAARSTLKHGMSGGDVPVLQNRLKALGDYKGLSGVPFNSELLSSVTAFQARTGLKADGVVGPLTWAKLAVAPPVGLEQTKNDLTDPATAVAYLEAIGWSHLAATALVASLLWESGGNSQWKLIPLAVGDGGKSHGAGQWNGSRYHDMLEFARDRGKSSWDMETQLAFVDHELHTTERRAAAALKVAQTVESANQAAISYWRPSIPHADKRLAIAKKLA